MLDGGISLQTSRSGDDVVVELPQKRIDPIATVVVLAVEGELDIKSNMPGQARDGSVLLLAEVAKIHNRGYSDQAVVEKIGSEYAITNWKESRTKINWMFNIKKMGNFDIYAKLAATDTNKWSIKIDKETINSTVEGTGGASIFRTTKIGSINLSNVGNHLLEIVPDQKAWKGVKLQKIQLKPGLKPSNNDIFAPAAKVEKLADGFKFTEGPAVDSEGNVFFTDQPNNKILKWSVEGDLSIFHNNPGRANGLYFDLKGNLLACADLNNELWSINKDGEVTILVKDYQGKKLNGPNDLWVAPDGGIYFTDPMYERPYWDRGSMEQDGEHVYYLTPDRQKLVRVANDLVKPNGIIGTPDGKQLYIADIKAKKTYRYHIQPEGSLLNKTLFNSMGSDGMTIDNEGNVYLTGNGVTVFNHNGQQIAHIPIDSNWTANVCFGGKDRKTLFITAKESLFGLRMRVKGVY
jgi:gluconolactonase